MKVVSHILTTGCLVLLGVAGDARSAVEAVSKAITPSETVTVQRGPYNLETYLLPEPPSYVAVSGDGRVVLFESSARNVIAGSIDPQDGPDLFLYDRVLRQTTLVSHLPGSSGPMNNARNGRLSEDGSTVIFESGALSGYTSLFVFDRPSGSVQFITLGGADPTPPVRTMSADGAWAVITGLGPSNEEARPHLYEKATGLLHPIAIAAGCGAFPMAISGDGRFVLLDRFCRVGQEVEGDAVLYDRIVDVSLVIGDGAIAGTLSRDGRFVLFSSQRQDVIPGLVDNNGRFPDLYRYDRVSNETVLVNRGATPASTWAAPGVDPLTAQISDDGDVVAVLPGYSSFGAPFIFRASTGSFQQIPAVAGDVYFRAFSLSGDGRTLAYHSWRDDIIVVDVATLVGRRVTWSDFPGVPSNGSTTEPVLSRDGSLVIFASTATNLGLGVRDFDGGSSCICLCICFSLYGVELPSDRVVALSIAGNPSRVQAVRYAAPSFLSADGRRAAFQALSNASDTPDRSLASEVPILRDRSTDVARRLGSERSLLALSADGSTTVTPVAAYRGPDLLPTNLPEAFEKASTSADGSVVAYVGVALLSPPAWYRRVIGFWDLASGQTTRITRSTLGGGLPDGDSVLAVISADGRFVAFESLAGDLGPGAAFAAGQENVFLYDRTTGLTRLVSASTPGAPADGATRLASHGSLSRDGRYLLMTTAAGSIGGIAVPPGGGAVLYDAVLGTYTLVSGPPPAGLPNLAGASMDAQGRFIVFGRAGGVDSAAFLFDRQLNTLERLVPESVGEGVISADGSTIAVSCGSGQLCAVDRRTRRVTLASHGANTGEAGNGVSVFSAWDEHGDALLFQSTATNLGIDLGFTAAGLRPDGPRGAFLYTTPPIVHAVAPACASTTGGRTVTIEGAHFKLGSTVTLDGIPATVTNVTSTAITVVTGARAPTAARTGNVEVRSPDGEYFALGNAFTYAVRGDANNSGALTAADGFYLNMALFLGGPQPASLCNGDANGSGATTSADAFFLNLYLFLGGAPPPP